MKEKFYVKNRYGLKIVGEVLKPSDPKGLAFVLHGLGGFKEQEHLLTLVSVLLENNYSVVNFDATNSFGESEGRYENATMQLHYEDLVDVTNWAQTQDWYLEPFVLVGHSLGGYAVARYAEDFPEKVKALFPFDLVVSGVLSHEALKNHEPEKLKTWESLGWKEEESKSRPGVVKRLPWSHMQERLKHNLLPNVSKLKMPILFVFGENDVPCPPKHGKFFYDALPETTLKEFHIIKGAPHTFRDKKHLDELRLIFSSWLGKI